MSMTYDIIKLNDILNIPKDRIFDFFKEYDGYYNESKKLKKQYNLSDSGFNIFSSISEVYHYENLHSDIVKLILDPETEGIGNSENIKLFVKLLNKIKPELNIEMGEEIVVKREGYHIDILVHDGKNAIIIENKINNATDQNNQIGRYYEKAIKTGYDVKAIVYLTLTPDKKLDEKKSIENSKTREKIKPLLIHVPVIDKDAEISFSDGFVKKCIECIGDSKWEELARVYYTQYYELIKSLGGNSMAQEFEQLAIKEIYADAKKLEMFCAFGDLWGKKNEVINEIVKKQLEDDLFELHPNTKSYMYRKIDDLVSLGYSLKDDSFGFIVTPGCKKKTPFGKNEHEKLSACFENLGDIFGEKYPWLEAEWVYKTVDFYKVRDFKAILQNFKLLEKSLKKQQ